MKNRTIIGIVCIILSVAIMFGIAPLAGKMASGKTGILRVVTDISQGKDIPMALKNHKIFPLLEEYRM